MSAHAHHHGNGARKLWLALTLLCLCVAITAMDITALHDWPLLVTFAYSVTQLARDMSEGVAIGVLCVGALAHLPQSSILSLLGGGTKGVRGIWRATIAGGLLDVCCHGVLLIAADVYKRGASLGQTVAFLVASPWNSFSTLMVLISLIGLPLTASIFGLSLLVAFVSGMLCDVLVARGVLSANPVPAPTHDNLPLGHVFRTLRPSWRGALAVLRDGLKNSTNLLFWLLVGIFIAASVRVLVPHDLFSQFFGPTLPGVGWTLLAATFLEVCSGGSAPLAAELVTRAGAPGNAFVFLMAGVATNLSCLMILREATGSWKTTLSVPLILVPQIVLWGIFLNTLTF